MLRKLNELWYVNWVAGRVSPPSPHTTHQAAPDQAVRGNVQPVLHRQSRLTAAADTQSSL